MIRCVFCVQVLSVQISDRSSPICGVQKRKTGEKGVKKGVWAKIATLDDRSDKTACGSWLKLCLPPLNRIWTTTMLSFRKICKSVFPETLIADVDRDSIYYSHSRKVRSRKCKVKRRSALAAARRNVFGRLRRGR